MLSQPPISTLFPYTTLFRSIDHVLQRSPFPAGAMAHVGCNGGERLPRSEEHMSELQSHVNLVCRLLLEKKNSVTNGHTHFLQVTAELHYTKEGSTAGDHVGS